MVKHINSNQMRSFFTNVFYNSFWFSNKKEYNVNLKLDYEIRKIVEDFCLKYGLNINHIKIVQSVFVSNLKQKTINIFISIFSNNYFNKKLIFFNLLKHVLLLRLKNKLLTNSNIKLIFYDAKKDTIVKLLDFVLISIKKKMPIKLLFSNLVELLQKKKNVKGFKLILTGRINGKEKKTRFNYKWGNINIATLKSKVFFFKKNILTKDGLLGARIWVNLYE